MYDEVVCVCNATISTVCCEMDNDNDKNENKDKILTSIRRDVVKEKRTENNNTRTIAEQN